MPVPYSYSSARMDKLIEKFWEAKVQDSHEYQETRSTLWREIQDAMHWARRCGYKEGQDDLIKSMKKYSEEKAKGL
jgi:hypothetical protein